MTDKTKMTAEQRLQRDIERNEAKLRKAEEQRRQLKKSAASWKNKPTRTD